MERTLYEILGVDKDAPAAVIKKAYRSLAQKLHPDKETGDADEFRLVQEAYDVLSDIERRTRYDATGTYRHETRQTEEDRVKAIANQAITNMLHKIVESEEWVDHKDIFALLRKMIKDSNEASEVDLAKLIKSKRKHEKVQKRIKAKKGDNIMALLMQPIIDKIAGQIKSEELNLKVGALIAGIVGDHDYEFDKPDDATKAKMDSEIDQQASANLTAMLNAAFGFRGGL